MPARASAVVGGSLIYGILGRRNGCGPLSFFSYAVVPEALSSTGCAAYMEPVDASMMVKSTWTPIERDRYSFSPKYLSPETNYSEGLLCRSLPPRGVMRSGTKVIPQSNYLSSGPANSFNLQRGTCEVFQKYFVTTPSTVALL